MNVEQSDSVGITERLASIQSQIEQLTDLFRRRLMDDKVKAQSVEALSKQAQGRQFEPLCREFFLLLDRIERRDDDFVVSIREEILEILSHFGVELIEHLREFDPVKQRIAQVSNDPSLPDGAIKCVIRSGYTLNGVVLRPQSVVVVKHSPKLRESVPEPPLLCWRRRGRRTGISIFLSCSTHIMASSL